MLTGKIGYTNKLTEYIINNSKNSDAVTAQLSDTSKDIFTGLPFKENTGNLSNEKKADEFKTYVNKLSVKEKADTYVKVMSIPDKSTLDKNVNDTVKNTSDEDITNTLKTVLISQMGMSEKDVEGYISALPEEDIEEMFKNIVVEKIKSEYAKAIQTQLAPMTDEQLSFAFDNAMESFTSEQYATYYDEVLEFSKSTYEDNLKELGYVDLDDPATINLFASSFENKDIIEEEIKNYNNTVEELEKITYTDYVGIMMSSITTIINAITYVLVAFVAVSLIVSSIMIGVITLISVQERTKEIGILRAIGASKRNVSSMFNAETVIIGFSSGALGVLVTYLLCIPINMILQHLTGITNLKAILPPTIAIALVCISIILTLFAGIIPSRSAAKKDPVVALRTE